MSEQDHSFRSAEAFEVAVSRAAARRRLLDVDDRVQLGRYEVIRRLGEGAMSCVYQARDRDLERHVAIKVLRVDGPMLGREALAREARALAKLSHPNVVTVFEVNQMGADLYLVTELVEGITLSAWLEESPRDAEAILGVFVLAGRGLAAVHEAGLVHRDFKPDNVMVNENDAPKVLDFGLARLVEAEADDTIDGSSRPLMMTHRAGTPAYMAPEQHGGQAVDARADQFGFCAALYEALYGTRPYPQAGLDGLSAAKLEGPPVPPDDAAPAWIWRLIERGLAPEPDDRHPDFNALLDALAHDPVAERSRRRRRMATYVGAATIAASVGFLASRSTTAPVCDGAEAAVASYWNPSERAAVINAFSDLDTPFAQEVGKRVITALDVYARAWTSKHGEVCEATRVSGHQSARAMDLRMTCLDDRGRELRALAAVMKSADVEVAAKADELVSTLPSLARCDDVAALAAAFPPPEDPKRRRAVEAAQARLNTLRLRHEAGAVIESEEGTRALLEEVEALAYPPLTGDVLALVARIERDAGQLDEAGRHIDAASTTAAKAKDDVLLARLSILRLTLLTEREALDEAKALVPVTDALVTRAGASHALEAERFEAVGKLHLSAGEFDASEAAYLRAEDAWHKVGPGAVIEVLRARQARAKVLTQRGKRGEAQDLLEEVLKLQRETLGPDHPSVAKTLDALGLNLHRLHRFRQAAERQEEALRIARQALGRDHALCGRITNNLANNLGHVGETDRAEQLHRESLRIHEKLHGPRHPSVALSLGNLAGLLVDQGQYEEAVALHRRELAILLETRGKDHPSVGISRHNIGDGPHHLGRCAEARPELEEAYRILFERFGADHTYPSYPLVVIATCDVTEAKYDEAIPRLERTLELHAEDGSEEVIAQASFELARALHALGREPKRVTELAERARDAYAGLPKQPNHTKALEKVGAWVEAELR